MEKKKNILIVAGEASGDIHAARLVNEITLLNPKVSFFGLGGQRLKTAGVELYYDIVKLAVVGIWEVVKNYPKFRRIFNGLLDEIDGRKPHAAILVDYPGFNLRLVKELKKRGIPVIYYISPQIWAWGEERITLIKETVSLMIVLFKFEENIYKKHGVPVKWTGHPLIENIKVTADKESFSRQQGFEEKTPIIALLPGSRLKEVKVLLPIMLESCRIINDKLKIPAQLMIIRSPTVKEKIFSRIISRHKIPVKTITDNAYDAVSASDFALVASGTATLETAILKVPMAILYKVSFLTWAFGKLTIKIPYIGLVNVVRGEKLIEEFIQYDARPERIASYVIETLQDPEKIRSIKTSLAEIAESIGEKGASRRAAEAVNSFLNTL